MPLESYLRPSSKPYRVTNPKNAKKKTKFLTFDLIFEALNGFFGNDKWNVFCRFINKLQISQVFRFFKTNL